MGDFHFYYTEENLGVYYFDPMWGKWFKVEDAGVDTENNTIYFATSHFTAFSVQPTMMEDLSPQELQDTQFSPFKTATTHQGITVSPQGGTAMTEMTEFVLPGKNGFDFVVKRMYDSATARGDAMGISLNAQLSLSLGDLLGGELDISEAAQSFLNSAGPSIGADMEARIKRYFQNNGDYAYSMGQGWRLNLPYIRGSNSSVILRLPDGGMYSMNQLNLAKVFNIVGIYRDLRFENHNGVDFTLEVTQIRTNVSFMGLITGSGVIPSWQLWNARLIMKDGTTYEFDALGRTTKITDSTGLNVIECHYGGSTITLLNQTYGLELDYIVDSMGRIIRFEYFNTIGSFVPRISKIWIENDTREVNYTIGVGIGDVRIIPVLMKAVDVGGREWNYEYDFHFLFSGGMGVKVNALGVLDYFLTQGALSQLGIPPAITLSANVQCEWVFSLSLARGPGIGRTEITYLQKPLTYFQASPADFFMGIFPTAVQLDVQLTQRLLVQKVDVYQNSGDTNPVRTTDYEYSLTYYGLGQFYNQQTVENDGRKKTIYTYNTDVKMYLRYIDVTDVNVDILNSYIASGFKLNGLFLEDPRIFEVTPYLTERTIYDAQSGRLLEWEIYQYDLKTMRILEQLTIRGANQHKITYTYDIWGNPVYIRDYSKVGDITTLNETWQSYINSNLPIATAPWSIAPYPISTVTVGRHDLPYGKITANHTPTVSGGTTVIYLHSYNQYNTLGQPTGMAQWEGAKWLCTTMEYDAHAT